MEWVDLLQYVLSFLKYMAGRLDDMIHTTVKPSSSKIVETHGFHKIQRSPQFLNIRFNLEFLCDATWPTVFNVNFTKNTSVVDLHPGRPCVMMWECPVSPTGHRSSGIARSPPWCHDTAEHWTGKSECKTYNYLNRFLWKCTLLTSYLNIECFDKEKLLNILFTQFNLSIFRQFAPKRHCSPCFSQFTQTFIGSLKSLCIYMAKNHVHYFIRTLLYIHY